MIVFAAIAAILVFLYINHAVAQRKEERRARQLERKQEMLEALMERLRTNPSSETKQNHEN